MKKLLCLFAFFFVFLSASTVRGVEESITLTTYYPAPFGIYQELAARRIKVGETYMQAETKVEDGTLIVENKVGIGTRLPQATLDVQGTAIARRAEVHGDAVVKGRLGVGGVTEPEAVLHVNGPTLIQGDIELKGGIRFDTKTLFRDSSIGPLKCSMKLEGYLFYNNRAEAFQYCDGKVWRLLKGELIKVGVPCPEPRRKSLPVG